MWKATLLVVVGLIAAVSSQPQQECLEDKYYSPNSDVCKPRPGTGEYCNVVMLCSLGSYCDKQVCVPQCDATAECGEGTLEKDGVCVAAMTPSHGSGGCPCLREGNGDVDVSSHYITSPIGNHCAAWDGMASPEYCEPGSMADWCYDSWCYVDPENCDLEHEESGYFEGLGLYYSYETCGNADQYTCPTPAPAAPFLCTDAEPQAPRDVTAGSPGELDDRVPSVYSTPETLVHVNTHYHLGAEHKSTGQYDQLAPLDNHRRLLATDIDAGWYCPALPESETGDYEWEYCQNTKVGHTYELHYVHSNAGVKIADGLGGAFAKSNNPIALVVGQVVQITTNPDDCVDDMMHHWQQPAEGEMALYLGSTTGMSYNNEVCSKFTVHWNVDTICRKVCAESFDKMCKTMIEDYSMSKDIMPHGSRTLVAPELSASELYFY